MKIRLLAEAKADELDAAEHYDVIQPALAARFLAELREQVKRIHDFPLAYPVIYREFRSTRIRKFPYRIVYLAKEGEIVVCAIFHSGRDPDALRARLDAVDE